MKNYLYIVSPIESLGSQNDTFDSILVSASDSDKAKEITIENPAIGTSFKMGSWVKSIEDLNAFNIGTPNAKIKEGFIMSSFNAG